jgi:hypothetical protein
MTSSSNATPSKLIKTDDFRGAGGSNPNNGRRVIQATIASTPSSNLNGRNSLRNLLPANFPGDQEENSEDDHVINVEKRLEADNRDFCEADDQMVEEEDHKSGEEGEDEIEGQPQEEEKDEEKELDYSTPSRIKSQDFDDVLNPTRESTVIRNLQVHRKPIPSISRCPINSVSHAMSPDCEIQEIVENRTGGISEEGKFGRLINQADSNDEDIKPELYLDDEASEGSVLISSNNSNRFKTNLQSSGDNMDRQVIEYWIAEIRKWGEELKSVQLPVRIQQSDRNMNLPKNGTALFEHDKITLQYYVFGGLVSDIVIRRDEVDLSFFFNHTENEGLVKDVYVTSKDHPNEIIRFNIGDISLDLLKRAYNFFHVDQYQMLDQAKDMAWN